MVPAGTVDELASKELSGCLAEARYQLDLWVDLRSGSDDRCPFRCFDKCLMNGVRNFRERCVENRASRRPFVLVARRVGRRRQDDDSTLTAKFQTVVPRCELGFRLDIGMREEQVVTMAAALS